MNPPDTSPIVYVIGALLFFCGLAALLIIRARSSASADRWQARALESERELLERDRVSLTAPGAGAELDAPPSMAPASLAPASLPPPPASTVPDELRCRASACTERATHAKPRIVRSEGMYDLVRRWFGAPRRCRMEIPPTAPAVTAGQEQPFKWPWARPAAPARYCDVHVHVAMTVCMEKLAHDAHAEAAAQADREASLTYFESAGLEARVSEVVLETERRQRAGKRKKAPEPQANNVVTFGARTNGTSMSAPS